MCGGSSYHQGPWEAKARMGPALRPAGRGGLPGSGPHLPGPESLAFSLSLLVTMKAASGLVLYCLSTLRPPLLLDL